MPSHIYVDVTVDFTADPYDGFNPLRVQFYDYSTVSKGKIIKWKWDFGDGSGFEGDYNQQAYAPVHVYLAAGHYDVTLTIWHSGYSNSSGFPIGGDPTITGETSLTKLGFIRVFQREDRIDKKVCLRFATEENEGYGWSECSGSKWLDPAEGGVYIIQDDNEVPRCIVEQSSDPYIYELDTFDRTNDLSPSPLDDTVEIVGSKWGKEITAGAGQEDSEISDLLSKIQVRPNDPDNRSLTGYTAQGLRSSAQFGLDVYVDGEKNTAIATTSNLPIDGNSPAGGDIVFSGIKIDAKRLQYVYNFSAAEFLFTEMKHEILNKPSTSSVIGLTTNEKSLQNEMQSGKIFHATRNSIILDRVNKKSITSSSIISNAPGADRWSNSGLDCLGNLILNNVGLANPHDFTILIFKRSTSSDFLFQGLFLAPTIYSPPVSLAIAGWSLYIYKGALGFPVNQQITNLSLGVTSIKIFDIRIYSKLLSDAAIADYYRNVSLNKGDAYLPSYVE